MQAERREQQPPQAPQESGRGHAAGSRGRFNGAQRSDGHGIRGYQKVSSGRGLDGVVYALREGDESSQCLPNVLLKRGRGRRLVS